MFGCVSYVHIDPILELKLDAKSNKCFLLVMVTPSLVIAYRITKNGRLLGARM